MDMSDDCSITVAIFLCLKKVGGEIFSLKKIHKHDSFIKIVKCKVLI